MTRDEILSKLLVIMEEEFELVDPGVDDDLREVHSFDSIDAITLLEMIEEMLDTRLSQEEKKKAMGIQTINQICDYIESLLAVRK